MIESGEKEEEIRQGLYCEGNGVAVDDSEFFLLDQFVHPVSGKSDAVPSDYKPQKSLEFKPAGTCNPRPIKTVKEVAHADYKKDMADLVRYQPLGTAMCLHRPSGISQGEQREQQPEKEEKSFRTMLSHVLMFAPEKREVKANE